VGLVGVLIIVSFVTIVALLYITLLIGRMKMMREDVTKTEENFTQIVEKLVEKKLENNEGVVEDGNNKRNK
jgi:hypothetical protein